MKSYVGIVLVAVLMQASLCHQTIKAATNSTAILDQSISDLKVRMDKCLLALSKKDATAPEKSAAVFSASFLFETYDNLIANAAPARQAALTGDQALMAKLCTLYISYAEYLLEDAKTDANPPSVSSLEKSFKSYQKAYVCLKALTDGETVARNGKWIEMGLARTIKGLNKYADWFARDAFMNPGGKKWEANPAPQAEKLRNEVAARIDSLDEILICRKAMERILRDIKEATEKKNGTAALDKMILGARWLTTILQKAPDVFIHEFQTFNAVTRPAMEEVKKGYNPEKMKEFSKFYEPLKSHYVVLSSGKK